MRKLLSNNIKNILSRMLASPLSILQAATIRPKPTSCATIYSGVYRQLFFALGTRVGIWITGKQNVRIGIGR